MPERPVLEAVLLDAGGTLIRLDFETMAEIVSGLGVQTDAATLRRAEIAGRRRYDRTLEAGARDPRSGLPAAPGDAGSYFGGMLEAAGVPEPLASLALERWLARQAETGLWTRPAEGALAALEELAALGLRRAVVSNSDGRAEQHLADCGLAESVEFVIDSHRVGVEKPDPRIFRFALECFGVVPERALYVGDIRAVDEAGARAAGLHFVLLDPYGDYAPPGGEAIPGIERLGAWASERFVVPAARGAGRGVAAPALRPGASTLEEREP